MEQSQESANKDPEEKVNLNDFFVKKFSRWTDDKGRLLIVLGFYYGRDHSKAYPTDFDRIGLDLLDVRDEVAHYLDLGRFIKAIIAGKILPWKDQAKAVSPF